MACGPIFFPGEVKVMGGGYEWGTPKNLTTMIKMIFKPQCHSFPQKMKRGK